VPGVCFWILVLGMFALVIGCIRAGVEAYLACYIGGGVATAVAWGTGLMDWSVAGPTALLALLCVGCGIIGLLVGVRDDRRHASEQAGARPHPADPVQ